MFVILLKRYQSAPMTCMYRYTYAKDLIWWADFRLQDVEKKRERIKLRQKRQKEERRRNLEKRKPPLFGGIVSSPSLTVKLGKIEIVPTSWGLPT